MWEIAALHKYVMNSASTFFPPLGGCNHGDFLLLWHYMHLCWAIQVIWWKFLCFPYCNIYNRKTWILQILFFHYRAAQTLGTLAIICCGSVITFYLMSYLGQLDIIEKARSHLSRVRCCCWQIKSCIYIKKYSSVNPHEFPYNHWQFLMHYKLFKRLLYTPVELLYNQHSFLHYSWATSV